MSSPKPATVIRRAKSDGTMETATSTVSASASVGETAAVATTMESKDEMDESVAPGVVRQGAAASTDKVSARRGFLHCTLWCLWSTMNACDLLRRFYRTEGLSWLQVCTQPNETRSLFTTAVSSKAWSERKKNSPRATPVKRMMLP